MTTNRMELGDALVKCADNLQWRVIETQAKIILHSGDCNKYSYFFDDEFAKSVKYPCMLGYKNWTSSMSANYLSEHAQNCKFQMPSVASDVEYFWEEGPEEMSFRLTRNDEEEANIEMPRKLQLIKENIEKHWNFLRHLAVKVVNHNDECKLYQDGFGKYGCLENFTKWDEKTIKEYYEPKAECEFLKKSFMC